MHPLTFSPAAAPEVVMETSNPPSTQKPPQAPPPSSCPQPPVLTKPPVKSLPTPNHPPRRSIFSFMPQNRPQVQPPQQSFQKRAVQDNFLQGLPPSNPPLPTREGVTTGVQNRAPQDPFPRSHPRLNPASENGVTKQPAGGFLADVGQKLPDSMWDASIIQTRPEGMATGRRRDQDKCSQQ